MLIHRNDPCPCLSGLPHKFCCRNRPADKPAPDMTALRKAVEIANNPASSRRERRAMCKGIAKSLNGVTLRQVFQPRGARGCIYGDSSKAQIAHFKRKAR